MGTLLAQRMECAVCASHESRSERGRTWAVSQWWSCVAAADGRDEGSFVAVVQGEIWADVGVVDGDHAGGGAQRGQTLGEQVNQVAHTRARGERTIEAIGLRSLTIRGEKSDSDTDFLGF
jgi:hypothetical protein